MGSVKGAMKPEFEPLMNAYYPNKTYVDRGYQGHGYPDKLNVFKSGQRCGVIGKIKKELRRRSAIEPIIGHAKAEHKMDNCRLKCSS